MKFPSSRICLKTNAGRCQLYPLTWCATTLEEVTSGMQPRVSCVATNAFMSSKRRTLPSSLSCRVSRLQQVLLSRGLNAGLWASSLAFFPSTLIGFTTVPFRAFVSRLRTVDLVVNLPHAALGRRCCTISYPLRTCSIRASWRTLREKYSGLRCPSSAS